MVYGYSILFFLFILDVLKIVHYSFSHFLMLIFHIFMPLQCKTLKCDFFSTGAAAHGAEAIQQAKTAVVVV